MLQQSEIRVASPAADRVLKLRVYTDDGYNQLLTLPHWQNVLREEAAQQPVESPTLTDLENYPLLDAAVKEILRMYAVAGTLFRQAVTDTEICGHHIPRKSQIAINVYASMRLHDWWPCPDTFNPDRFTTAAHHESVSRYIFAPFGGGAHKCVGQQFADMTVKTVMHQLLRRFAWCTPSSYEVPLTWGTGPTPADTCQSTSNA